VRGAIPSAGSAGGAVIGAYGGMVLRVVLVFGRFGPLAYPLAYLFALGTLAAAMALLLGAAMLSHAIQMGPWGAFLTLISLLLSTVFGIHHWVANDSDRDLRALWITVLALGPVALLSAVAVWILAPWLLDVGWQTAAESGVASRDILRNAAAGVGAWDSETWIAAVLLVLMATGAALGFVRRVAAYVDRALSSPLQFAIQLSKVIVFTAVVGAVLWFVTVHGLHTGEGFEALLRNGAGPR